MNTDTAEEAVGQLTQVVVLPPRAYATFSTMANPVPAATPARKALWRSVGRNSREPTALPSSSVRGATTTSSIRSTMVHGDPSAVENRGSTLSASSRETASWANPKKKAYANAKTKPKLSTAIATPTVPPPRAAIKGGFPA